MKKSEVLALIEECAPNPGDYERETVIPTKRLSEVAYFAAYRMYSEIRQKILSAEEQSESNNE